MTTFIYYADIFGVIVFALSGALMAGRYRLDPFGVMVLAAITAVGGGTIRDIILGAPVFWTVQTEYIVVIFCTALATILFIREPKHVPKRFMHISDAFGLALFAVLGTQKALAYQQPMLVAIIMGTITGVAGGMIRDVICNQIPLILRQEIYATAALIGSVLFVVLIHMGVSQHLAGSLAMLSALVLRLAGIYWQVSLPAFKFDDETND
ncbi:trimeric intracellular cation channel family protein [Thalassotalea ponticola]|uniref:trimeric intracellular cation channel family protein n=1 Tax=Thalassotalea ponticola TaxID=1523392 RepID=UPI0025B2E73E|nr:trimeric intracellular cation channel family protein [Thalassotalea ponticola]MDN3653351.1 trimeric intracellular cation channel family protein [Thalassotalea ponticola]